MKKTYCDKCQLNLSEFPPIVEREWQGFSRELCPKDAKEFDDDIAKAERQIRAKWFPETMGVPCGKVTG